MTICKKLICCTLVAACSAGSATRARYAIGTVTKSGSGAAMANTNTPDAHQVNTFTESSRPGQTVLIYGTGLGATPQAVNLNTEVLVGGREANVLYKGRSSCC